MARIFEALRRECRPIARQLLGCDCGTKSSASTPAHPSLLARGEADAHLQQGLNAIRRAYLRIEAAGRALSPDWAPLAIPAEAAMDELWKVPPHLRTSEWYQAYEYLRRVKACALEAAADAARSPQGSP